MVGYGEGSKLDERVCVMSEEPQAKPDIATLLSAAGSLVIWLGVMVLLLSCVWMFWAS